MFAILKADDVPQWVKRASGVPAILDLDFVNNRAWSRGTKALSDILTCSRSSSGYYTDAAGNLTNVGSNLLRYGSNGLLVEESRTNLAQQSQTFDNAYWTKTGGTSVTANQTTAPDGTLTADKFTAQASQLYRSNAETTGTYTVSVYAKYLDSQYLYVQIETTTSAVGRVFDIQNGSEGSSYTAGADCSFVSSSMLSLANGWYRLSVTGTISTNPAQYMTMGHSGSSASITNPGAVKNSYVWGAQMELGSFATSYIPTTTGSVTRNADVVTGSVRIPTSFGSVLFEYNPDSRTDTASQDAYGYVFYNASNDRVAGYLTNPHNLKARLWSGGTGQFILAPKDASSVTGNHKLSYAFSSGDSAASYDGLATATSSTTYTPSLALFDTLAVGCAWNNTSQFNGYIRRLSYFPPRVVDPTLRVLAT